MLSGFLDSNFCIQNALGAMIRMLIPHPPITTVDLSAVLGRPQTSSAIYMYVYQAKMQVH